MQEPIFYILMLLIAGAMLFAPLPDMGKIRIQWDEIGGLRWWYEPPTKKD
jgi:hypothetical protein